MPVVHETPQATMGEDIVEDDEKEVMVKTEFVWADGAENDVKLSGAWNGWMTIQMYHEGGGMWSVVTPVPVGSHQFKFVVDGEWRHSSRHPTVGDDQSAMNNIRVVKGPPKQQKQAQGDPNAQGRQGAQQSDAERSGAKTNCCTIC